MSEGRINSGRDLAEARKRLGWSVTELAAALWLAKTGSTIAGGQDFIRNMERERREVSGPIAVSVEAFLSGWRPAGFEAWLTERRARLGAET